MKRSEQSERLLTRDEVTEVFAIPKRFLEVSAMRGDGPTMVKVGRLVRYRRADIEAWIDARTVHRSSCTKEAS